MTSRDRHLLLGLAALPLALAALTLVGVPGDVLLALPSLLVVLPLLAGRYVGEERLARLEATFVAGRPRPAPSRARAHRTSGALPRGGGLIAASLAVRPPPAALRPNA